MKMHGRILSQGRQRAAGVAVAYPPSGLLLLLQLPETTGPSGYGGGR